MFGESCEVQVETETMTNFRPLGFLPERTWFPPSWLLKISRETSAAFTLIPKLFLTTNPKPDQV